MSQLRWGAAAPSSSAAARARLIDAAEACFARFGVMKTTVEDVAAEAQVSRATVYRYFEGRDELILGVLMREANRFLGRLATRIEAQPTFAEQVTEAVLFIVDAVRADENLALLFAPDAAGVTGTVAGTSDVLFRVSEDFFRPYLEEAAANGGLRPGVDIAEASEWIIRTVLSMLTVAGPARRRRREQRRYLLTFLAPALAVDAPEAAPPRRRS